MQETLPTTAPLAEPGTSHPDEFQLPVAGLFADLELGTGCIRLPEEFTQGPALVQLKVIGHWQRALARYRQLALRRFANELTRGAPELDDAARTALLRKTCDTLRIDLPAEFQRRQPRQ